jgi:hypothetical protein
MSDDNSEPKHVEHVREGRETRKLIPCPSREIDGGRELQKVMPTPPKPAGPPPAEDKKQK